MNSDYTDARRKVWQAIRAYNKKTSLGATYREIAFALNTTVGTVQDHVRFLHKFGYISKQPKRAGSMLALDKGEV